MGYAEKRKDHEGPYYRARYKRPDGKGYGTVLGSDGKAIKYPTRRQAEKAARDKEHEADVEAGRGRWVPPEERAQVTLAEYVLGPNGTGDGEGWLDGQDLAPSTVQAYRQNIKHILDAFGETVIADITGPEVDAWEKREKAGGAASSAATYRRVLHLILEDAIAEGHRLDNPAKRRRNRGRRAGRSTRRGPEKKITNSLGILLLAERASLLSGRDDEFVATVLKGYTGMRWGEVVGLEPKYVRDELVRVEQQLWESESGPLVLCPPKDDSYRGLDAPRWLTRLVRAHIGRSSPTACPCHGLKFTFNGRGASQSNDASVKVGDVAKAAGVSVGTVSNALNHPERVAERTRTRVMTVIGELGFVRGGTASRDAAHWRRSGHATWIFTPAATGWYPPKAPHPRRPVPILAEPWPGVPARGRGAAARATASWLPIQDGLTRHGLRHTHRTVMEELGTPKVLVDERMGHTDTSVSANYAHITDSMRLTLVQQLTALWEGSLATRLGMCPTSPVPVLEQLLRDHERGRDADTKIISQFSPERARLPARHTS